MARTYKTLSLSLPPGIVERLRQIGASTQRQRTAARVAADLVRSALEAPATEQAERLRDENAQLWEENAELRHRPLRTFDRIGADRLADEVAVLVHRGFVDMRSPVADALLDYRDPPSTPRAERLARLEGDVARLEKKIAALEAQILKKEPG